MSVSVYYRKQCTVALAMGRTTADVDMNLTQVGKAHHQKPHVVQCHRCAGFGTEGDSINNCPVCGGKGVLKLSPKALRRAAKKMELANGK